MQLQCSRDDMPRQKCGSCPASAWPAPSPSASPRARRSAALRRSSAAPSLRLSTGGLNVAGSYKTFGLKQPQLNSDSFLTLVGALSAIFGNAAGANLSGALGGPHLATMAAGRRRRGLAPPPGPAAGGVASSCI